MEFTVIRHCFLYIRQIFTSPLLLSIIPRHMVKRGVWRWTKILLKMMTDVCQLLMHWVTCAYWSVAL